MDRLEDQSSVCVNIWNGEKIRMKVFYAFCCGGLLAVVLMIVTQYSNNDAYLQYRQVSADHHERLDRNLPAGSVLFFGSSTVAGIDISAFDCPAANYGLGGEGISELNARFGRYKSAESASLIVLQSGLAQILNGEFATLEQDIRELLQKIANETPILMLPLQPARPVEAKNTIQIEKQIKKANLIFQRLCSAKQNCQWLDQLWEKESGLLDTDGVHLSKFGYSILQKRLITIVEGYC